MRLVLILLGLLAAGNASKILILFPAMTQSHFILGYGLAKGLAARGHDVTFATPFEEKEPIKNVKSLFLSDVHKLSKDRQPGNMFEMFATNPAFMIAALPAMGLTMSEATFADPAIQAILNGDETYDAVISVCFAIEALQGVAYRLKAASILFTTMGPSIWLNYLNGAPNIYSYMPHPFLGYNQRMTFYQRVKNLLMIGVQNTVNNLYYLPQQNKILHKYVPEAPHLDELIQNVSLHLFNSDPSYNGPLPLFPNMVEIGGYHIDPLKKLPDDLQKYLDESKDGVIYFSMGSILKSKNLPQKTRDSILHVLSKLKENVLWKFEEDLPNKPKNVEIRSWLPQRDILAHPNVKLFISHGGLLGTTEGIYCGVPILGIPVFGDQDLNMEIATNRGYGTSVPYSKFTEEKFAAALEEMLTNSSYSQKAKEMSAQIRDKQATPLDTAGYWVEYVIRHKGAHHLKTPALELPWYQYYSVDVVLLLVLVTMVSLKIFCFAIKKLLCRKNKQNQKQKRN